MPTPNPWLDESVPAKQGALAEGEFTKWKAGEYPLHHAFNALRTLLAVARPRTMLEVGCGAGYHAMFAEAAGTTYAGCDLSPAMVAYAKTHHPKSDWRVADQVALPYPNRQFEVVMNGCALICLSEPGDWVRSLDEARRVARTWVLLHRVPVVVAGPSRLETNGYYGPVMSERFIAEAEWRALLAGAGLEPVAEYRWRHLTDPNYLSVLCAIKA